MPYFDSTKVVGIPYVDSWVRGFFDNPASQSEHSVVPFALQYPKDYDPQVAYPVIVCQGGSYSVGHDCLGYSTSNGGVYMFNSAGAGYYLRSGTSKYSAEDGYFVVVVQARSISHSASDPWFTIWIQAVVALIKSLRDTGNVTYYTNYGTALDAEVSLVSTSIDNGTVLGSNTTLPTAVNFNSDRIYYTGYSDGGRAAWFAACEGRDVFAGILALDVDFPYNTLTSGDDFTTFAYNFLNFDVNYWAGLLNASFVPSPTGYDTDYIGNSIQSANYSQNELAKQILSYHLERIKHIPVLCYNGTGLLHRYRYSNKGVHALWNELRDAAWADYVWINRYRVDDHSAWQFDPHWSSELFQKVFGVAPYDKYVFDGAGDLSVGLGLTGVDSKGSLITCWDWLLSKSRATNPAMEADAGYPTQLASINEAHTTIVLENLATMTIDGVTLLNTDGVFTIEKNSATIATLTAGQSHTFRDGMEQGYVECVSIEEGVVTSIIDIPRKYACL